jgi:hypothetical protein
MILTGDFKRIKSPFEFIQRNSLWIGTRLWEAVLKFPVGKTDG